MSNEPILLFLHGIGPRNLEDPWRAKLSETLCEIGYPSLDDVSVIAPKYSNELKGFSENHDVPPLTLKQPSRDLARKNRRDFERRIAAVEFRLGQHDHGQGSIPINAIVDGAINLPGYFTQARNYLGQPSIRGQVLEKILRALPTSGRLLILAHSLGSVIAADLLRRLPVDIEVIGLVTIGSPLANGIFNVEKLRDVLSEPPVNLGWWINFWNANDPVAANRGVSSVFPWLIDLRVPNAPVTRAHGAVSYLGNEIVAEAIGYALFGSLSKEIEKTSAALDLALDTIEKYAVLAIRFADLIATRLDGDLRDRYRGALRQVQATVIASVLERNAAEKRPVPYAIARLAFDLSDPDAQVPTSLPSPHLPPEEAAVLLSVLATENIVRPFEIAIAPDVKRKAMEGLAAEMGLTTQFGTHVFEAAEEAGDVLAGGRGMNWVKIGMLGAGAAALVLASGGLVLAAGAGLAGAAAITSALAAFGPGGMIGGLVTAGTLMTAGGGGIAYSLASLGTSAEAMEGIVQRQLTLVMLRDRRRLEQDPEVWRNFSEAETRVRREHERLDEFSDPKSTALKELKKKITTLERALSCLREKGLEPGKVDLDPADFRRPGNGEQRRPRSFR